MKQDKTITKIIGKMEEKKKGRNDYVMSDVIKRFFNNQNYSLLKMIFFHYTKTFLPSRYIHFKKPPIKKKKIIIKKLFLRS